MVMNPEGLKNKGLFMGFLAQDFWRIVCSVELSLGSWCGVHSVFYIRNFGKKH